MRYWPSSATDTPPEEFDLVPLIFFVLSKVATIRFRFYNYIQIFFLMMRCLVILPGAPICEYVGVLRRTEEVDVLLQNNFIFVIDCLQTMKGLDGQEKRAGLDMHMPSLQAENDFEGPTAPEYCIHVGSVGSFTRFINHICNPNIFVQCILTNHHDVKLAKVMLFVADTILPLQVLCYDYGYVLNSVVSADGEIVKLPCYCQKRLY